MTNHRGTHRPTYRQPSRLVVVLTVSALLALGSAVGVYAVHAGWRGSGQSRNAKLAAESAHLGGHSRHIRHGPPHIGAKPTPVAIASTHNSPSASAKPTQAPTATTTAPGAASGSPAAATNTSCGGTPNTPGGADPWGGCWPGPSNTGVPAGISLTAYNGPCTISVANTMIDAKLINCALEIAAPGVTIQDSKINGTVYNNSSGVLVIKDTEIDGGNDNSETVGGNDITILGSNLHGDQHEVYCGDNCVVENSWLHDNFNGESLGWHQNGFLSNGGSNYIVRHNSVYCVGGCTSDIGFIPDDNISNATVDKNLLVATAYASYCLYPSSDHPSKPGVISGMVVTDNVFQRGANGKCAFYGAVYGWDIPSKTPGADGNGNVWSGNMWDNEQALGAPS
jgi:hypothetical protein